MNLEPIVVTRVVRNLALLNGFHLSCLFAVAYAYRAPLWLVISILATTIFAILPAFRPIRRGMGNACTPSYSMSPSSGGRQR